MATQTEQSRMLYLAMKTARNYSREFKADIWEYLNNLDHEMTPDDIPAAIGYAYGKWKDANLESESVPRDEELIATCIAEYDRGEWQDMGEFIDELSKGDSGT